MNRFRYFLLSGDPGLQQLKHGLKTVIAVVITLQVLHALGSQVALYGGMAAGFLMQSTAGTARRTRQKVMGAMGAATTVLVGIGSEISGLLWAKDLLLVLAAFAVFYVRRWIPGKAMFPIFAFTLTLFSTVQPGGAQSAVPMMIAVSTGAAAAFGVMFFVLRDESPRALGHAADLFLHRLKHGLKFPGGVAADLAAMHRALAFEEEEREHLHGVSVADYRAMLQSQYEAVQVLTLLDDTSRQPGGEVAARFSRDYLAQVVRDLEEQRAVAEA